VTYKYKQCNFEGCNKHVVQGGVCVTHGAIKKRKLCSFEGCTNQSRKGGVCVTHGATRSNGNNSNNIDNNTAIVNNNDNDNNIGDNDNNNNINSSLEVNVTKDINFKGDNVATKKGCEDVNNDDVMHLNIIHITSTEGGREVNLRILSL
jgi:hypothetical protein